MASDAWPSGAHTPAASTRPGTWRGALAAHLTYEGVLWMALACAALLTRLWQLGIAPLSDTEATQALNALALLRGQNVQLLNPLYGAAQATVMSIFGANDFSARLIPALSGAAICVLPLLLRRSLGRGRALIFGALLTLSPTLWFVSRQADGGMLAWVITFAAWAAWQHGAKRTALIMAGLLLACGQDAVSPLLIMLSSMVATAFATRKRPVIDFKLADLALTGVIFILASTALLWNPGGLGDAFTGLSAWWQGIVTPGPMGLWRAVAGLGMYELLIMMSAAAGVAALALRGRFGKTDISWLAWIASGLVFLVLTQSRDAATLLPLVIGAAALAASAATMLIESLTAQGSWRAEGALMGLAIPMLVYGFLGLSMYAAQRQNVWLITTLLALFILTGIGIIASLLFDAQVALRGLGSALGLCLTVYTLGVGYHLTQVRITNPAEPYVSKSSTNQLRTLVQAIEAISTRALGDPNTLSLQVLDPAPPALRWALRNQRGVSYVARLNNSAAALTPLGTQPESAQVYIGDTFQISNEAWLGGLRCQMSAPTEQTSPDQLDCTGLARWFTNRQIDEITFTRWILWLRQDIALKASGH